jgi:catechol 2,3-dioxygenase-like lactoylglutathione lyase family enzyme
VAIAPSRIFHVNVNCTDLGRSLAFYSDVIGLKPATRTTPEAPQPGAAFGLDDDVKWDAWILQGDAGYDSPVLDLLQWQLPPPIGVPPQHPTATGFIRLCFTTSDLEAMHERIVRSGGHCRTPPRALDLGSGTTVPMFICLDPDGVELEFIEGRDTRMSHIAVNCADLDRSRQFYEDVVGLVPVYEMRPPRQSGELLGVDGEIELRGRVLSDPASGFMVELVGWDSPKPRVERARQANELGIFRMAWLTDDIDRDHAALLAAGVSCFSPPVDLHMGPGLPDLRALLWRDPDGACLELIETPR